MRIPFEIKEILYNTRNSERRKQGLDLNGGKRKLKAIEFWHDTKGLLNGKADVTVVAIK